MTLNKNFKKIVQPFGIIMIIAITAIFISDAINAQSKQKVAVYVTGDADSGTKKVIGAKMVSAITKDDGYAAVERTADFLAELSKEQSYQRSGAVDDRQIAKLGEQFGVAFVCVADVSMVHGSTFIAARMINVRTSLIIATADRDKEINGMADLTELSEDIADGLINDTAPCNKKDKPIDKKGCCQGLVAVNGICRDISNGIYWINTKSLFGLEILIKTSNDTQTPAGWRIPTADDLVVLSKYKTELKGVIPFQRYRSSTSYSNPNYRTLRWRDPKNNYSDTFDCGEYGFLAVDMENGNKYQVMTTAAIYPIYIDDWNNLWNTRDRRSDLQYPPFYVR